MVASFAIRTPDISTLMWQLRLVPILAGTPFGRPPLEKAEEVTIWLLNCL
jgi:hypothetical protein